MDFIARKKFQKKVESDNLIELYPTDLQFYNLPPGNQITLQEFEDLALERLQVLRILEQATQRGNKLFTQSWFDVVKSDLRKQKLVRFHHFLNLSGGCSVLESRRADHLSHFILRLAYCRSEALRSWFLARELEWFKTKFITIFKQNPDDIQTFFALNHLTYNGISNEEKQTLLTSLLKSTIMADDVSVTNFYKVPFNSVTSLVNARRVFVKNGQAYIPQFELVTCIQSIFRARLSEALAQLSHIIPNVDDERLNNLLQNLHISYTGQDYNGLPDNKSNVRAEFLDYYSKKQFPLCMRHIHQVLRSTHHLKYRCRLQYGLFLKGLGLSLEECLKVWRDEFTKTMDENTFEKKYAYGVKHQHGKVGGMVNYKPYSCMTIIMGNVGPGEHHGCPFKHFDATQLRQKLVEDGIPGTDTDEIMTLVKDAHYQIACTKYFELTHHKQSKSVINHPNQYFDESDEILNVNSKKPT
ncbi:hypothetical protein PPYR_08926 [Photinus pyralis]|uniref:DNA primase large subunit n=1 Tax=Photinus pyralis TaxID=7054 RepID=A0A1Y1LI93_PHOPY|nr:DNA primase large subunit [Photinus pyralis]KAB0797933.1 hypothetical protein PPYR_08926 [Photinus pyralis]